MAAPALDEEQKAKLIEWLVAGFPEPLIRQLFQAHGWKPVTHQAVSYHREQHRAEIDARVKERLEAAYDAGLAQREARVKALCEHADRLAALIWLPDEKGKLHNEKAWREALDDIAREMGHRRQGIDLAATFGKMTDAELDEYITTAESALAEGGEGRAAAAAPANASDPGADPAE